MNCAPTQMEPHDYRMNQDIFIIAPLRIASRTISGRSLQPAAERVAFFRLAGPVAGGEPFLALLR